MIKTGKDQLRGRKIWVLKIREEVNLGRFTEPSFLNRVHS